MPIVNICDADGKTVLKQHEEEKSNWGFPRTYSAEAMEAVDAYYNALLDAAKESRELFAKRRGAAARDFHVLYPDGKLPDEEDDKDA